VGDGEKEKNGKWEVHYRNTWKPVKFMMGNMFSKCTSGKTTQATLQSTFNKYFKFIPNHAPTYSYVSNIPVCRGKLQKAC